MNLRIRTASRHSAAALGHSEAVVGVVFAC